jgi:hypothetical protein
MPVMPTRSFFERKNDQSSTATHHVEVAHQFAQFPYATEAGDQTQSIFNGIIKIVIVGQAGLHHQAGSMRR